jgi:hypothetical protein
MLNVKQTLKNLHKRLPTLSLDELFELLDCYVEQSTTFPNWEPPTKIYYSTDKTNGVGETAKVTCITNNTDPGIYTIANCNNGKVEYYDGGGSTQLVAKH